MTELNRKVETMNQTKMTKFQPLH